MLQLWPGRVSCIAYFSIHADCSIDTTKLIAQTSASLKHSLALVVSVTKKAIVLQTVHQLDHKSARIARRRVRIQSDKMTEMHFAQTNSSSGHSINECKNPRKIDRSAIADADPEQSWQELIAAVAEKDIDDFKTALAKYLKSCPDLTYLALEEAFRVQAIPVYIIALERELTETYTNMDLQGNLGKTYSVSYRWSAQPRRPKERDGWPSVAENKERLQDAGEAVDIRMTKCNNCNALGHGSRSCPEEKQEPAARTQVCCMDD